MDLAVGQDEENHVLVVVLLELFALGDSLFEQLSEVCRSAELCVFQDVTVLLDHLLNAIQIRVVHPSIDRKTVMYLILRIQIRVANPRPKPIHRDQLIIIIVH